MLSPDHPSTLSSVLELFSDPSQTILIHDPWTTTLETSTRTTASSHEQSEYLASLRSIFLEGIERIRSKSFDQAAELFLMVLSGLQAESSQGNGSDYSKRARLLRALSLNNLGYVSQQKGEFDNAVIAFYDALSNVMDPSDARAHDTQAHPFVYTRLPEEDLVLAILCCNAGRIHFIEGDYNEAEACLSRAETVLLGRMHNVEGETKSPTNALVECHLSAEFYLLRSVIRHTQVHVFLDIGDFRRGDETLPLVLGDISLFACAATSPGQQDYYAHHNEFLGQCISCITTSVEEALSLHVFD